MLSRIGHSVRLGDKLSRVFCSGMIAGFFIAFVGIDERAAVHLRSSAAHAALGLIGTAKMRKITNIDGPIIARFQPSSI
ncbi:hypothetical protein [Pseudomonas maumuensis]|uniref:Uncharacterized protein n=1 Tax=Pseudomonas maumuensis TaxID=2842354 RepID=A0ABX8NRP9_9PSED|nr:hypothetical protein [Pseudomonas maumuensis]QXH58728.1 hypothetical protein KSS90_11155 [Pseudomonas maumuensis]